MIIISLVHPKKENNSHQIDIDPSMFRVTPGFIISSLMISGILVALYTVFW
jgi:solute:Na+ symporter, SSS family